MGFGVGSFAKCWSKTIVNNHTEVDMSISKKKKDEDGYDVVFKYKFVRFVGEAHKKIQNVPNGSKIKITSCDVEYTSKKNDDGTWKNTFKPVVFDFVMEDGSEPTAAPAPDPSTFVNFDADFDGDCPFN